MFGDNVTRRLVSIENEQRAQKVATLLDYGQLIKPESVPTATYSGHVSNSNADPVAIWIATFTRTDGIDAAPLVDFAWDISLAKSYNQDYIDAGYYTSIVGRDRQAIDQRSVVDAPYEFGSGYVKWKISIPSVYWYYVSSDGTDVFINMQAISMVPGNLILERTR